MKKFIWTDFAIGVPPFFLKRIFLLCLVCLGFYLFGNDLLHLTDPDEVFYSLTAREMAAKNEWMTPYIFGRPQFEKPPMTYWLLEMAFKNGGESAFTARFFPAVFAVLGIGVVYWLGLLAFKDERKAFLSALVLASCGFYAGIGKMVFTDVIFTVFILCSMAMFMWAATDRHRQAPGILGFYVFCALSTLTKGPLGLALPQMAVVLFLLYQRQIRFLKNGWWPAGILLYLALALPWYLYMYDRYGHAFIQEFFYNDHWRRLVSAEHKGNDHWFFYPATMVGGFFPWSLFVLAAAVDLFKRLKSPAGPADYLSLSWVAAVLVVFQFAHSKLASYVLPLFPALALMVGNFLGNGLSRIQQRKQVQNLLLSSFFICVLLGIAAMAGYKIYRHYVPSPMPEYFLSGSLIALSGIGASLAFRERFEQSICVLALAVVPFFLTAFMIRTDLEGYVSSYEASQYIPSRTLGAMTVLTSKNNARGIRYYSGQDVAVVDSGKPFFSPHPIPVLDTTQKIMELLKSQRVTLGVVRKNVYKDILKSCARHYHVGLLKVIGFDYIIRVEALRHP